MRVSLGLRMFRTTSSGLPSVSGIIAPADKTVPKRAKAAPGDTLPDVQMLLHSPNDTHARLFFRSEKSTVPPTGIE